MNERDYILATNCARLQMAMHVINDVLVVPDDSHGLDGKMLCTIRNHLSRLVEQSFRAMEEKGDA